MKKLHLIVAVLIGCFSINSVSAQSGIKTDSIKVWGNCGMCKKKIEKAAKSAGASVASWNEDTQVLKVSYNSSKSSSMKIQQAIANTGYDTQDVKADDKAYRKLDACCHYERKTP